MTYPRPIENLIELLQKLPGIGPRQATRFALFIVKQDKGYKKNLINALERLDKYIDVCTQCFQSIDKSKSRSNLCIICQNSRRRQNLIAVVEKEPDMHNLEKTGIYNGMYHILGGVISPLDPNSPKRLRLKELHQRIKTLLENKEKVEVILATSATTEGDTTALYIEQILNPLKNKYSQQLKISRLGRGLSIGVELEYADETTIKNALANRK